MPSFVPSLYQLLSEPNGWPPLRDAYLGPFSDYLDPDRFLVPIADSQRDYLAPVSIGDWLERGQLGTPMLTANEVGDFLEGARRETREGDWEPTGTSCWRFLPTSGQWFALFPDAGLSEPTFDIGISVKTSPVYYQLSRLSMPWLRREDRAALGLPADSGQHATASRDACSLVGLDRRQPGRSYVGQCVAIDCGGPCGELLGIDYTNGQTVLTGCQCEGRQ
jgi:hypothetical protein